MNSPFSCIHKQVLIFYSLTDIDDLKYLNKINSGLRLPLAAPKQIILCFDRLTSCISERNWKQQKIQRINGTLNVVNLILSPLLS